MRESAPQHWEHLCNIFCLKILCPTASFRGYREKCQHHENKVAPKLDPRPGQAAFCIPVTLRGFGEQL